MKLIMHTMFYFIVSSLSSHNYSHTHLGFPATIHAWDHCTAIDAWNPWEHHTSIDAHNVENTTQELMHETVENTTQQLMHETLENTTQHLMHENPREQELMHETPEKTTQQLMHETSAQHLPAWDLHNTCCMRSSHVIRLANFLF